jgi:hypothetical protein
MDFRLPIPKNWQDFESICHRLWIEIWNDPNAQKNGRQGQGQDGVDIYGTPIYSREIFGVQCKDKDGQLGSFLTAQELTDECSKAKKFSPEISSFTMATTAPRDAKLQEKARQLTSENKFPFDIQVWSWDDIQSEIVYRQSILDGYYNGLQMPIEGQSAISLNRFSPKEQFYAYFSRPAVKNLIDSQIKEGLISLGYELSDNAYLHGKATDFRINVEPKKVIFTDNGIKFNPLEQLDPSKTSAASHAGSFVLDNFLKQFKGIIETKYYRIDEPGKEQNFIEFNFSNEFGPLNKKDFLELYVDWRQAAGRDAARRLALSIPITPDIKEIIWTVTDSYALSFFNEFILSILSRMSESQILTVSLPRDNIYRDVEKWYNDKRLRFKRR